MCRNIFELRSICVGICVLIDFRIVSEICSNSVSNVINMIKAVNIISDIILLSLSLLPIAIAITVA